VPKPALTAIVDRDATDREADHRREPPARWAVRKTIAPMDRGAIKLARQHGPALVCVRYRVNAIGDERLTTVELVVERAIVERRNDPVVAFKIHPWEDELRQRARQRGARYDAATRMWKLVKREVLRLGLRHRIAMEDAQR
jgi:hypothetical protein